MDTIKKIKETIENEQLNLLKRMAFLVEQVFENPEWEEDHLHAAKDEYKKLNSEIGELEKLLKIIESEF